MANSRRVQYNARDNEWWVRCDVGHVHYGEHGAAGLLLRAPGATRADDRYFLQHRPQWADDGSTWGIPGGALRPMESPRVAALREAREEMGHPFTSTYVDTIPDDHGGWVYWTVLHDVAEPFFSFVSREQTRWGWFTRAEMRRDLVLHPGFAATLGKTIPARG